MPGEAPGRGFLTIGEWTCRTSARSPSRSKRKCGSPTWTTRCPSSSAARCRTSATASSPSTAACSTRCRGSGSTGTAPYKKAARVIGDCMGKYHPARRRADLRGARADGPGVLAALSAGRRAGELRVGRRRPAGGDALHRSAAGQDRARDAGRHRQGHRRLRPQLRRVRAGAGGPARRGSRTS